MMLMTTIRPLKDLSVLTTQAPKPRTLSPLTLARREENERLRDVIRKLTADRAFEVVPDPNEKQATVRARLLRAAKQEDKAIAIRKYRDGFAVGLMTPERRSRRGRPPKPDA
jgi:hypothetical protein